MSEPQLSQLLDRAVHHAPPMHLDGEHLLAAGKGRVRRRRVLGAGGGLAAAALAVAVWGGLAGGSGFLTGELPIQPATTVWEPGEVVDADLFTGYQTIGSEQVGHSFDGRLTRPDVDGPVVLELSDHGEVVEQIPAHSPLPGLEVFTGERMTVAVWAEPDGVVSAVPLVGPVDPGGPSSRTGVELDGERYGYSVWPADVTGFVMPEEVLDVYLVGQGEVVALSGAELETAELHSGGESMLAFADASRGIWGYAVDGQEAVLEQLGDRPAHFSTYNIVTQGDSGVVVLVLPEGAEDVGTDGDDGADLEHATLHGRPVVLLAAPEPPVPVHFTLAGTRHDLDSYVQDLVTLDTTAGRALSLRPGEGEHSVALHEQSAGEKVLGASQEELRRGLVSRDVDGGTVTLALGWNPGATVLADSRVEITDDDGSRWVAPTDVAQVPLTDGTLITALAVDVADPAQITAVGRQVGDEVERWEPAVLAAGVEWRHDDGSPVPYVEGRPMPRVDDSLGDAFRHYAGRDGATSYLVLPGMSAGATFVPLVTDGDRDVRAAPEIVDQADQVEIDEGVDTVLSVSGGLGADGTSRVIAVAALTGGAEDNVNTWQVLGDAESSAAVVDSGVVVSHGGDHGVWLLYPPGSIDPAELQAGAVGGTVLEVAPRGRVTTLVAVLPEGTEARLVGEVQGALAPTATTQIPERGVDILTWTVQVAGDEPLAERGAGLDTDGDWTADILLQPRD